MIKKYLAVIAFTLLFATGANAQCSAAFSNSVSNLYDYHFIYLGFPDASTTYYWNFGDGDTASAENPSHTFASLVTYDVCLTVHDSLQNCSATHCDTIAISCPAVAGFDYTRATDYDYNFNYTSTSNEPVTWHWNFGDGDTANTRNVAHTFAHTGIYHVCLTVTDVNIHCTSDTCEDVIICVAEANFTHTNSNPYSYSFTDASAGEDASTTFLWNFGDGDSATSKNTTYTFPGPGTYDVCFTIDVHDSGCSNQYCTAISVACPDSSNFSYVNTGGLTFQFTDLSIGEDGSVTYSWSFGDGTASSEKNPIHMFTAPSSHNVCLTIRNVDQGCTNTFCTTVAIACSDSAGFTYVHSGAIYNFSDASQGEDTSATFEWNFGDGDTSTAKSPNHTFASFGTFQVCLKMTDVDVNCFSQFCENINVVNGINEVDALVNNIRVYPNPSTGFVMVDLNGFKATSLIIYNQLGEKVKQVNAENNASTIIDISTLAEGVYLVSAKSENEVLRTTMVVTAK